MRNFQLNDDDVIDMPATINFVKTQLSTFAQLKQGLREFLKPVSFHWLDNGIECRVLRTTGGGWQTGKIRFSLEFIPDEPPPDVKPDEVP
ncbi:MAG TPA: KGK domain-containing protein [Waterburya sp.]|jgi:hypothetical protein